MVGALVAVAHVAQADGARHVLQLAVAVGGAGQAVERMVGDVELHHALRMLLQALRSASCTTMPVGDRRGARGRRAVAALDLDQAQAARAEASSMSVAHSFGICVPISIAARMIDVPSGTVTSCRRW